MILFENHTKLALPTTLPKFENVIFDYPQSREIMMLEYNWVTSAQMIKHNINVLSHDYDTDIITQDFSDDKTISAIFFVNPRMIYKNALNYKQSFKNELFRVLFHGFLHLLDFDDNTPEKTQIIRNEEDRLLKLISCST